MTQDDATTVYDFVVNASAGQWEPWSARVPLWKPPKGQVSFGSLLVPTADSVCHEALLRAAHSVGRAGLLVGSAGMGIEQTHGITIVWLIVICVIVVCRLYTHSRCPPGTAKTCTVNQMLTSMQGESHVSKSISFSYFTTPNIFQTAIEVRTMLLCVVTTVKGHTTRGWWKSDRERRMARPLARA